MIHSYDKDTERDREYTVFNKKNEVDYTIIHDEKGRVKVSEDCWVDPYSYNITEKIGNKTTSYVFKKFEKNSKFN